MIKKSLFTILVGSFLVFTLTGCDQSARNNDNGSEEKTRENWEEFKSEMNDVGDAIGDLFQKEDEKRIRTVNSSRRPNSISKASTHFPVAGMKA